MISVVSSDGSAVRVYGSHIQSHGHNTASRNFCSHCLQNDVTPHISCYIPMRRILPSIPRRISALLTNVFQIGRSSIKHFTLQCPKFSHGQFFIFPSESQFLHSLGDQIKENKMCVTCTTHGGEEKYIQGFCWEI